MTTSEISVEEIAIDDAASLKLESALINETLEESGPDVGQRSEQEEAFNAETGEINWDCPCIAPMVQPPCGEKFKEAFACFVYSKMEPKGSDCVDKFREMQTCFQAHPDVYGDLATSGDDDDEDEEAVKDHVEKHESEHLSDSAGVKVISADV